MKTFLTCATLALTLTVTTTALARPGDHNWRKGGHIANDDWNRGQAVDYHSHHLRRPPHGYEWRQVDGNFVLAAVATGVIASVIAASR